MSLRSLTVFIATFLCLCQAESQNYPLHRKYDWCSMTNEDMQGDIRIPVLFVGFEKENGDNETRITESNQKTWLTRLNDSHPTNHMKSNGSVNDYFLAQSYGLTNVTFERIGEYIAPGKAADYAESSTNSPMARNALLSLNGIDWSRYDSNGDKEVDCLLIIYAGHSDGDLNSKRATISSIYPHMNWFSNDKKHTRLDLGDGYTAERHVFAQSMADCSTSLSAINTICHELSHGIFDLCDYYRGERSYMGQYDALCYGFNQKNYGSTANHCCDYTAFNRMYLGWLTPIVLKESQHVILQPLSRQGDACILFDPANSSHFFLLENRAKLSNTWDANLPEGGLVLTEVNYRIMAFEQHNVNNSTPRNIQIIKASTSKGLSITQAEYYDKTIDHTGVPYGPNGRTEIPATVHPLFASHRITHITINADHSIEFDYENLTDGICPTPLQDDKNAATPFDLTGRRMLKQHKGIYILNGRKYKIDN